MGKATIVGTGSYLPGEAITNEQLEALVGPLPPDILAGIQVERRYWIIDPVTGEHRINNSVMAYHAATKALEDAGVAPGEVDLLVCATASPDYLLPPLVTMLQEQLGIQRCAVVEVRSGCAGAVEALDIARLYLEAGLYHTAVVVGSETISPLLAPLFLGKSPDDIRMRDRMNPYNFGDGAGAMVLRVSDRGRGILGSAMACVGGDRKPGMQIVGTGGTHAPLHQNMKARRPMELKVDVVESGRFTPYVMTQGITDVLRRCGVAAESIDVCIIPEGNAGYVTEELRAAGLLTDEWVALESKIVENLAHVGATGSAAVPLALDDAYKTGKIQPGNRVMLLAIETSKWIYAGTVFDS